MRAMKCDRCSKIYKEHEGMTVNTELARIYLKDRKTYDLCPECMKELEDFLENTNEGAQNNERL